MRCCLQARQCISATVGRDYEPPGGKPDASFVYDRPFQRTFCNTRLSAHAVRDRRDPLPAFANLLGLYGRGDRAAWDLGGGRDGHCAALPLPPLGHRRIRSGAKNLAERCAVVAPLDLCRARPRWTRRGIGLSSQGITKAQFSAAMERLLKDNKISIDETGPKSRRSQKLVPTMEIDVRPAATVAGY
jgi:hypothetical protein